MLSEEEAAAIQRSGSELPFMATKVKAGEVFTRQGRIPKWQTRLITSVTTLGPKHGKLSNPTT